MSRYEVEAWLRELELAVSALEETMGNMSMAEWPKGHWKELPPDEQEVAARLVRRGATARLDALHERARRLLAQARAEREDEHGAQG
jgi:hypothetical protein